MAPPALGRYVRSVSSVGAARAWVLAFGVPAIGAACGSGSGDPATGSDPLVSDVCDKLAATPCAKPDTKQKCLTALHSFLTSAEKEGCQAELDTFLNCANSGPIGCSDYGYPEVSSQCYANLQAFYECAGLPGDCEITMTAYPAGQCKIDCQTVSASCQSPSPGGPMSCVCVKGPKAGQTFQATECSETLIHLADQYCT